MGKNKFILMAILSFFFILCTSPVYSYNLLDVDSSDAIYNPEDVNSSLGNEFNWLNSLAGGSLDISNFTKDDTGFWDADGSWEYAVLKFGTNPYLIDEEGNGSEQTDLDEDGNTRTISSSDGLVQNGIDHWAFVNDGTQTGIQFTTITDSSGNNLWGIPVNLYDGVSYNTNPDYYIKVGLENASLGDVKLSHVSYYNSVPVPEPATVLLLGSGLVGLAGFCRRFRKK